MAIRDRMDLKKDSRDNGVYAFGSETNGLQSLLNCS